MPNEPISAFDCQLRKYPFEWATHVRVFSGRDAYWKLHQMRARFGYGYEYRVRHNDETVLFSRSRHEPYKSFTRNRVTVKGWWETKEERNRRYRGII